MNKALLENDISKLVVSLLQHANPHTDEQDSNSADKCCVSEGHDVNVGETQKALREIAVTLRVNDADMVTEEAPNLGEFLKEQAADGESHAAKQTVSHSASCNSYDHEGFLTKKAQIDSALQRLQAVPVTVRARILYLYHYPTLEEHPKERHMHDSMCQHFYWPQMANGVYKPVCKCHSCA